MREFKPLDDAQEILGKLFIEASAGTGKTFAIEHVVRRLVLQGVPLNTILITTFTRAGTRDLKKRIHANLQRPVDDAEIHTIHSFCHRMLTEYAFEARTDPHLASPEDEGQKNQMATAILDTLRSLSAPLDFLTLVNACQRDVGRFVRKIASYLADHPKIMEDSPFHRMAKKAEERLLKRKIKNPDALLETMLDRLSLPTFKKLVQGRFRAVIVDEFQDTDPKQWEIFDTLFNESAETFLVVGDPKQSIYGFRGADLATFFKAKNNFTKQYVLSTNYRSAPGLIDGCNSLFGGVKGLFTFDEREEVQYHPVKAGREGSGGEIVFAVCEGEKGRSTSWPTQTVEEEKLFPYIASEIGELGELSIAILVKDRYQAARLSDHLSKQGIFHISTATSNLVETESFRFLELAFELANYPRNLNYLKQFLLHPFVGWPKEKVASDLSDPDLQKQVGEFSLLGQTLQEHGTAAFLRELYTRYSPPDEDLLQLVEIVLESDKDPRELLEELKTLDPDEHPYLKRKPLGQKSNVTIMTSHMSKGLEFDVVFALGIASRTPEKDSGDPLITDQEKMRLLYVASTRARQKLYLLIPLNRDNKIPALGTASPLELLLARQNKPFLTHEETYAAIADLKIHGPILHILPQSDLIHPVPLKGEKQDEQDRFAAGYTRCIPRGIQKSEFREENARDFDQAIAGAEAVPVSSQTRCRRVERSGGSQSENRFSNHERYKMALPKQYLSFSSIASPHAFHTFSDNDPVPQGSHTGSLFHLLFEKIIEIGLYSPWDDKRILHFLQNELSGTHLESCLQEVFPLIKTAFHTPLNNFTLKDIPPVHMLQEMQFLYTLEERKYMKGFADLIFHHHNTYYILDWKLNRLPSYDKDSLEQAMQDNQYYTQASIYAEALKRYLEYIPEAHFGGSFYFFLRGKAQGLLHFFSLRENR